MDFDKLFIEKILYPAMETFKGNRVRQYTRELLTSAKLSPEAAKKLQAEKLAKLLKVCMKSVPAYNDIGWTEEEIDNDPFEALRKAPILTKEAFRKNPEWYINKEANRDLLIPNHTGGSTGEPVKFFMDRFTVEHYEAARWRGLSMYGLSYGSRSVMIWGDQRELGANALKKNKLKDRYLKNRVLISAYDISSEKIEKQINFLNRYLPEYIYGYVTAVTTFAKLLLPKKEQLKCEALKAVVTTSETLYPEQRQIIENAFGCRAVNEYGARDAGILAYECPRGGMHICSENTLLEIADPKSFEILGTGKSGIILTTDLNNFVQPRLRYALGDTGTLSDDICSCEMGLPMLESLGGREDDMFMLPSGRLVHGHFSASYAELHPGVAKFQLAQDSPTHAKLRVVLAPGSDAFEDAKKFLEDLRPSLSGVEIELSVENEIPLPPSGKHRYAVRSFSLKEAKES